MAVKVLAERFVHDQMAVRRFKREARAAARVSAHAHVVTIFDVGDLEPDGDGQVARAFIVMEYLAGGTVADAIRMGAVNRPEALRWLREAASALDHAHERGIVHRDIKPANFLLDQSRVLHVADFGIARLLSEDTITISGELFGTAAYLAPEQALGRDATGASDRYALAVAAFELLVGERPFTGQHFAAQARQHIDEAPPNASERNRTLPPTIDPVLTRGMAKQPNARFETAGALVDALEAALAEDPTAVTRVIRDGRRRTLGAVPVSPAPRAIAPPASAARGPARRAVALAALLIAVLGVAIVALGAPGGSGKSSPARTRTVARAAATATDRGRPAQRRAASSARHASASTTTTPAAAAAPTAAQLQLTGHQEMLDGSYRAAIATLRQAISAVSPASLTYAYALYDLGRSLTLAGEPSAAVPILEQRLKIPNQTGVVRQMLDQALRASGQAAAQPAPSAPPKPGEQPSGSRSG